jgi:MscS family membrane protein
MGPPPSTGQIRVLAFVVLTLLNWQYATLALAQIEQYPLEPPDQSSPRATLQSFVALVNSVYLRFKTEGRSYQSLAQNVAALRLGTSFFDVDDVAPSVRANVARETAVFIKEVLDRSDCHLGRKSLTRR